MHFRDRDKIFGGVFLPTFRHLTREPHQFLFIDIQILFQADWLIEMGPGDRPGGRPQPGVPDRAFLAGTADIRIRDRATPSELFDLGTIYLSTGAIHTVKPLEVDIPKGRLTVVTGVSDSGKTTLILESLVPGLTAAVGGRRGSKQCEGAKFEIARQCLGIA